MKRILFLILLTAGATVTRAQVPVVDVAVLAETIATVAELRRQVSLLLEEVALSKEIKENAQSHLRRYQQSFLKRGLIPSEELGAYINQIHKSQQTQGAITWEEPDVFQGIFPMYQHPVDPLAAQRDAHEQTMATFQGTLASLKVHNHSVHQAQDELEQMKMEITRAKEPQQMRDVQANLQIMHTRELLLTRHALMTLMNLQAVHAAEEVSQKAQARMRYDAFVGEDRWSGDPSQYDVHRFLKMPGEK